MKKESKIPRGVYLVIDPSKEENKLLEALARALEASPCAVQIWDNFSPTTSVPALISKIKGLCKDSKIPLLINNHPEWVELFDLDGVHFDEFSDLSADSLRAFGNQEKIVGITINNDFEIIRKSIEMGVDYLSFCSIFPSSTSTSCELVEFETIRKTRKITNIPIFLAGGINPSNISKLQTLNFDGIAAISGVMSSTDPQAAILNYQRALSTLKS